MALAGNRNNIGLVGDWYTPANIEALKRTLCPGDRLEFDRGVGYAHWGIHVGQYCFMQHGIIHFGIFEGGRTFSAKKISCSAFAASRKPEILAGTIGEILGGCGKVRVNNSRDETFEPLDTDVIIEVAKTMHQNKMPIHYSLVMYNCEHFVNLCRYDKPHSQQILGAARKACYVIAYIYFKVFLIFFGICFVIYGLVPRDVMKDIMEAIDVERSIGGGAW